jgi:antitoxin component of MazEF toxin-antitoxin module
LNKIITVGNGLAVLIPKKDAQFFDWNPGENVMVFFSKDEITIKRMRRT